MREADFIAALQALPTIPAARGLADDAAVLAIGGETVVLTHDMMVEGVHWHRDQDAADVGWKLAAANLSDLAAKGCTPIAVLLGYMLGEADWNVRFLVGLNEALARHDAPLIGGDTVAGPRGVARAIGMTALGRPVRSPPPARADARPGEALWVTGTIGAALSGFEALRGGSTDAALTAPFRRPVPRLCEGRALAPSVGAMMDVSDGLLLDARRMAMASDTTIDIATSAVPLAPALSGRGIEAMGWGDDYELLFTLPKGAEPPVPATRIGEVRTGGAAPLLIDGMPPPATLRLGYDHAVDATHPPRPA